MLHNSSMLIDSHCHLDYFPPEERPAILARAAAAGVGEMISIGTRLDRSAEVIGLAEQWPNVWCSVGTHPHHAAELPVPTAEEIAALAAHPRCVAIGESGLDYFYDKAPREAQLEVFRLHARAAGLAGVPLVIHTRDADEDTIQILQEEQAGRPFSFLLHCFSSGRKLADVALEMGASISFSGMLTFKKSQNIRDIAKDIPLDRLLVETDSPYLAPVPYRGKTNEPALVVHTARVLAEVKGISEAELAEITTANFRRVFAKAA